MGKYNKLEDMEAKKWLSENCPHLDKPSQKIGLYELCLVMEEYHKHKAIIENLAKFSNGVNDKKKEIMSTKNSILLTEDNEHWYTDCAEPLNENKDAITLEFSKKNIRIDINDNDDLIFTIINPDCEIYDVLELLQAILKK